MSARQLSNLGGSLALAVLPWIGVGDLAWGDDPKTPERPAVAAKPQKGEASYYGEREAGQTTASGDKMDPDKLTAASPSLPFGTKAKVTNTETGKSVNVTVNDRGPYVEGRIIDVTPKAAERLGMKEDGVAPVKVQPVAPPKPKP